MSDKGTIIKNKYLQQDMRCIFVGLPDDSTVWLFDVTSIKKTYISLDVTFDKYFTCKKSSICNIQHSIFHIPFSYRSTVPVPVPVPKPISYCAVFDIIPHITSTRYLVPAVFYSIFYVSLTCVRTYIVTN